MFWTCRKKSGQSNNFWVSYGPFKYVYKWWKMGFSGITPKYWHFNTTQRTKLIQKWILYACTKFGQNWLRNALQKFNMAATKCSFFCHFNIRPRWFPAHHRDRLVYYFLFWKKKKNFCKSIKHKIQIIVRQIMS